MKKKLWNTEMIGQSVSLLPTEWDVEEYQQRNRAKTLKKIGIVVVKLFWTAPEQDYIKAFFLEDNEAIVNYGNEELATWIGGVALSKERQRVLQLANRNNGSFDQTYGWRPSVFSAWEPNPDEKDMFVKYETSNLDEEWEHFPDED